jgi:hypothetical protein
MAKKEFVALYYGSSYYYYSVNNAISEDMFFCCTSLTSITIGNSVTSIGSYAFSDCTGLAEIHCKNPTPPSTGSSCFDRVNETSCKLYVPKGSSSAYRNAPVWKDFSSIIEE